MNQNAITTFKLAACSSLLIGSLSGCGGGNNTTPENQFQGVWSFEHASINGEIVSSEVANNLIFEIDSQGLIMNYECNVAGNYELNASIHTIEGNTVTDQTGGITTLSLNNDNLLLSDAGYTATLERIPQVPDSCDSPAIEIQSITPKQAISNMDYTFTITANYRNNISNATIAIFYLYETDDDGSHRYLPAYDSEVSLNDDNLITQTSWTFDFRPTASNNAPHFFHVAIQGTEGNSNFLYAYDEIELDSSAAQVAKHQASWLMKSAQRKTNVPQ